MTDGDRPAAASPRRAYRHIRCATSTRGEERLGVREFGPLELALGGQLLELRIVLAGNGDVAGGFRRAGRAIEAAKAVGVAL